MTNTNYAKPIDYAIELNRYMRQHPNVPIETHAQTLGTTVFQLEVYVTINRVTNVIARHKINESVIPIQNAFLLGMMSPCVQSMWIEAAECQPPDQFIASYMRSIFT